MPPEEEGQPGLPLGADKEEREAYLQKRMVDFVKRRVLVLEKVLNAEYHCTVCHTVRTVELLCPDVCTMLENAFSLPVESLHHNFLAWLSAVMNLY